MKPRILLVDDEESIRRLISQFLANWNYEVVTASTGEEGFRLLMESPFHLAILDVVLTDTDGLELMEKMKAARPELPVVLLSGAGFDEMIMNEAKEKGADGYASKTLPLPELLLVVRRVLKQYKKETHFPDLPARSPSPDN